MVDKSLKRASFNDIFHDIKGVQWVWSDNVRGYISNIGGYSTPHKKLRENTVYTCILVWLQHSMTHCAQVYYIYLHNEHFSGATKPL